eukprot:6187884-Pleurochrysis_carterae.AAC.2
MLLKLEVPLLEVWLLLRLQLPPSATSGAWSAEPRALGLLARFSHPTATLSLRQCTGDSEEMLALFLLARLLA